MPTACIGIGSNLGDRARTLDRAVEAVADLPDGLLLARSDSFSTAPEGGPPGQGPFLNAAILLETNLPPERLLDLLQQIEARLGRPPLDQRTPNGPRIIDLDLLLYDRVTLATPALTLPHPRMHQRRFVLEPLAEVAPDMIHPLLNLTVRELLQAMEHRDERG